MIPQKQSVQVTFSGSIDTKTDPKQVMPTDFLALNNMVFTTGGELTKRNGYPSIGTTVVTPNPSLTYSVVGSTITDARKIIPYNNELLVNDAFNLYSYDESIDSWVYKGRSTMVALSTYSVAGGVNTYDIADVSIDITSGIKVFAYGPDPSSGVSYSIQDTQTGQFIINQASMGPYNTSRCISISGKSWILAINNNDGKLYYQEIVGQAVTGSPVALVSNVVAYDADVDPFSGNIYITYYQSTPTVTIALLNTSMAIVSSISKSETATHGLSFFGDGTNIWVVYNNASATKSFIVNNAVTATVSAPTVIDSGATAADPNSVTGVWSTAFNKAFIFYDPITLGVGATNTAQINFNVATLSGSTITPGIPNIFMVSLSINSKAFTVSGIPHVVGLYTYFSVIEGIDTPIQSTNFLLNVYNVTPSMGSSPNDDVIANIASKISPDESANGISPFKMLPSVRQNASGAWELALLQNVNYSFTTTPHSPFFSPTGVIDCQFDFSLSNPDAQNLGNNAIIAAGQVGMYDGANVVEQNFHIYPNALPSAVSTGGALGNASVNSTYSYIYLYEWIDSQGQVHRSFPSPVVTPLASGQTYTFASGVTNGRVVLQVPCLSVTNKSGSQVVINVYRTIANGSVYFLLGQYGTILNDPTRYSISLTDDASDDSIQGNLQIYTTGAQGYFAPPAAAAMSNFKNRALVVPAEGGYDFLYSNQVLPNFPVQFVPFFDQNIGTIAGQLITLAQMDDKIIIFKSGKVSGPAILYMVGQGPAPSGSGNDFTDPLPIAVDAGCEDRSSVVLTPVGLMFKSNKGIYLLDRSLSASYIGAPVEAYNQYKVVSAQLIPNTTQVRFLLSSGTILMYDYFYKRWGTFSAPAGVSDCIFQGQHTYVSSSGIVYKENPGVYFDGISTPVLMNFTTSWIKLAGLQGYQRIYFFYVLAEYLSAHQLSFSIAYNFASSASQTTIITPNPSSSLENLRIFLAKQRCQAFQVSLQEIYGGTPGAAFSMSGLNLIVGAKSSFRTISAAQSVG